jgi:hypothetical protein
LEALRIFDSKYVPNLLRMLDAQRQKFADATDGGRNIDVPAAFGSAQLLDSAAINRW